MSVSIPQIVCSLSSQDDPLEILLARLGGSHRTKSKKVAGEGISSSGLSAERITAKVR
jgi:hypothetical protein